MEYRSIGVMENQRAAKHPPSPLREPQGYGGQMTDVRDQKTEKAKA
jgi:hypothetical protein